MIRDVGGSYRKAIVETVYHYSGQRPSPESIDALKAEGCWNNDWEASLELLRRQGQQELPAFEALVEVFNSFYFGGDPEGDPAAWAGFIRNEPLLVDPTFFACVPADFPFVDCALASFDGDPLYEDADPMMGDHPDWGTHVVN